MKSRCRSVKFLLISLIIHVFLFSAIILVFPVDSKKNNPDFIFLGSILNKHDLLSGTFFIHKDLKFSHSFSNKSITIKNEPLINFFINKPVNLRILKNKKKKNLKTIFKPPDIGSIKYNISNEDLGLPKEIFQPIKFNLR